jgi:hypothetical protein
LIFVRMFLGERQVAAANIFQGSCGEKIFVQLMAETFG